MVGDSKNRRVKAVLMAACLVAGLSAALGISVQAQSCSSSGSTGLAFGAVTAGGVTNVRGTVNVRCQGVGGHITYVRMCVYIADGSPISGIAPRLMTNNNGAQMEYDLYSDAAHSLIIGPPPAGGGFPLYIKELIVPDNGSASLDIDVFGRVPAGQNLPATYAFQSQINNSQIRWAAGRNAYPATCDNGKSTGAATFYMGVNATFSNSCTVSIGQASDLNFGSVDSLTSAVDGTSTIALNCPSNTSWKLGLNNGQNALSGQRRMAGPTPDFIGYELYSDAGRTKRWGNDTAGGTNTVNGSGASQTNPTVLTVYGRVPAQAVGAPGNYVDTITVTLTY